MKLTIPQQRLLRVIEAMAPGCSYNYIDKGAIDLLHRIAFGRNPSTASYRALEKLGAYTRSEYAHRLIKLLHEADWLLDNCCPDVGPLEIVVQEMEL